MKGHSPIAALGVDCYLQLTVANYESSIAGVTLAAEDLPGS